MKLSKILKESSRIKKLLKERRTDLPDFLFIDDSTGYDFDRRDAYIKDLHANGYSRDISELLDDITLSFLKLFKVKKTDRVIISENSISKIDSRVYEPKPSGKPGGVWYGFGDSWYQHITREVPNYYKPPEDLRHKYGAMAKFMYNNLYVYKLEVDESKLLVLETLQDYKKLISNHGRRDSIDRYGPRNSIDWKSIVDSYSGIEFPTYSDLGVKWWSREIGHMWIDALDTDSGCIWDPSAVTHLELINDPNKK